MRGRGNMARQVAMARKTSASHPAPPVQGVERRMHMRRLTRACERIERIVDRVPRSRRIVGMCPECGREVLAAKGETLRLCKCGSPINVTELREQSRAKAEAIHLTKTPAGMSRWLRENYGTRSAARQ